MNGIRGITALLMFCFAWCLPATPGSAGAGEEDGGFAFTGEIVIGATFPRTGKFEMYGQSAYYGAETRVRMINNAGGINGKKLVLIWRDNQSVPAQAVRDVKEFIEKYKVPAILGPLLSDATLAVSETAKQAGVVVMTPMATVNSATLRNDWVFRTCFTNFAQVDGLIRFQMEKFGAVSAGVLYDSRHASTLEQGLIFRKMWGERGGTIVGSRSFVGPGGVVDYKTPLTFFAEQKPDFIFAPCYASEAIELIHAARDLGISTRFVGPDTWDNELVFDGAGKRLAATSFASALFEQAFNYRPFRDFYDAMEQAGMDNPDGQAACAYDAVTLLADALGKGYTAEEVKRNLLNVRRRSLATGRVSITPDGETLKPVIIRVVEVVKGRVIPVFAERYDP